MAAIPKVITSELERQLAGEAHGIVELSTELRHYLDDQDRLKAWPSKRNQGRFQQLALAYLATKLVPGTRYTEPEINGLLNQHHRFGDLALLRRELFERGWVNRLANGSAYWLAEVNPAPEVCP